MSTTALKLTSLAIRTLAKPIATRLKSEARDHPRFRKVCIAVAQQMHRFDMSLRLGLLRDPASAARAEKLEREKRHAEALKRMKAAQAEMEAVYPGLLSSVRSDVLSPEALEEAAKKAEREATEAGKEMAQGKHAPRIRPLSESKAIDAGANFISEAFLFAVAGSLILVEALRARRKEANRRDMVQERLTLLEDRNRQDEERLEALEGREREDTERIWRLEMELWRLKGEKGPMPVLRGERREWEKKPLWVEQKKKRWLATWNSWLGLGEPEESDGEKGGDSEMVVKSEDAEKNGEVKEEMKKAPEQDAKVKGRVLILKAE